MAREAFDGSGQPFNGPTVDRAAAQPNSNSDQLLAATGSENSQQPYVPPQQPAQPSWLTNAPVIDDTFQPVAPAAPTWAEVGGAAMRSMVGTQLFTWAGLQDSQPDMAWVNNTTTAKFGTMLDGLNDDEKEWLVGTAVSAGHAQRLRAHLDQNRADDYTFATHRPRFLCLRRERPRPGLTDRRGGCRQGRGVRLEHASCFVFGRGHHADA